MSSTTSLRSRVRGVVPARQGRWQAGTTLQGVLDPAAQSRLIWACLAIAVAARSVRFLLKFPLWEDECFLVANFIDRGYLDLLGPLNFHQVAPVLFLWTELTAAKLFGFAEWPLRLFPFACSIGGLLLFRRLAGQLLEGLPLVMAVAAFSLNYSGIRYAAEAKPYGPDQFVALALLTLAVEAWRRPRQSRWLWLLAAVVPLAVGLSYPAVFMAGGISLTLACALWTSGDRRGWIAWSVYNAALVGSFALLLLLAREQAASELGFMQDYWKDNLPSLASPLRFVGWLIVTHTSELMSFPVGGERGASTLSFVVWIIGLAMLWRTRRWTLLLFCLAPAALNIIAAMLGRYPYGGHVKFAQYLAPAICIVFGIGGDAIVRWHERRTGQGRRALVVALAIFSLVPLGTMARDFASPYKSKTDLRYRDFARWFWFNAEFDSEAACLKTDLGQEFAPGTFRHLGWSAMYLCNQKIYSPRHARGEPLRLDLVSEKHPLRVVQFRAQVYKYDQAAFDRWLASMKARYDLVSRDTFAFPCFDQRGQNLLCLDHVDVFKFAPKRSSASSGESARSGNPRVRSGG